MPVSLSKLTLVTGYLSGVAGSTTGPPSTVTLQASPINGTCPIDLVNQSIQLSIYSTIVQCGARRAMGENPFCPGKTIGEFIASNEQSSAWCVSCFKTFYEYVSARAGPDLLDACTDPYSVMCKELLNVGSLNMCLGAEVDVEPASPRSPLPNWGFCNRGEIDRLRDNSTIWSMIGCVTQGGVGCLAPLDQVGQECRSCVTDLTSALNEIPNVQQGCNNGPSQNCFSALNSTGLVQTTNTCTGYQLLRPLVENSDFCATLGSGSDPKTCNMCYNEYSSTMAANNVTADCAEFWKKSTCFDPSAVQDSAMRTLFACMGSPVVTESPACTRYDQWALLQPGVYETLPLCSKFPSAETCGWLSVFSTSSPRCAACFTASFNSTTTSAIAECLAGSCSFADQLSVESCLGMPVSVVRDFSVASPMCNNTEAARLNWMFSSENSSPLFSDLTNSSASPVWGAVSSGCGICYENLLTAILATAAMNPVECAVIRSESCGRILLNSTLPVDFNLCTGFVVFPNASSNVDNSTMPPMIPSICSVRGVNSAKCMSCWDQRLVLPSAAFDACIAAAKEPLCRVDDLIGGHVLERVVGCVASGETGCASLASPCDRCWSEFEIDLKLVGGRGACRDTVMSDACMAAASAPISRLSGCLNVTFPVAVGATPGRCNLWEVASWKSLMNSGSLDPLVDAINGTMTPSRSMVSPKCMSCYGDLLLRIRTVLAGRSDCLVNETECIDVLIKAGVVNEINACAGYGLIVPVPPVKLVAEGEVAVRILTCLSDFSCRSALMMTVSMMGFPESWMGCVSPLLASMDACSSMDGACVSSLLQSGFVDGLNKCSGEIRTDSLLTTTLLPVIVNNTSLVSTTTFRPPNTTTTATTKTTPKPVIPTLPTAIPSATTKTTTKAPLGSTTTTTSTKSTTKPTTTTTTTRTTTTISKPTTTTKPVTTTTKVSTTTTKPSTTTTSKAPSTTTTKTTTTTKKPTTTTTTTTKSTTTTKTPTTTPKPTTTTVRTTTKATTTTPKR